MPKIIRKTVSAKRRIERDRRQPAQRNNKWIDLFPQIHGTVPEKMVYAELTRLGIPFLFLNDVRFQLPEIEFDKSYQADFVIPSLKLIIEVQGAFWHSKEKTIESDAFKFAIYEVGGYRVLAWWDYDILSRLQDLFIAEPALMAIAKPANRVVSTELNPIVRTKIDTSKGIRTLNSRRKRAPAPTLRKKKLRKGIMTYATSR